jgi:hypothetical protein
MMAVTAMAMPVDAMRSETEPASRAAIGLPGRPRHRFHAWSAIAAGREAHRDRADCDASHHCQHDTARAFHGAILAAIDGTAVLAKR